MKKNTYLLVCKYLQITETNSLIEIWQRTRGLSLLGSSHRWWECHIGGVQSRMDSIA